ncbi:class I tRNA ligase family protein [candidate division WOR-3 bacterium]|nr:class I tRNA ligase family protein [candidate division WOR-3 bacterium]
MPYGNKELHLGHIGGVFVHADCYARFLRDRIGKENVIFVSGTDCYGSPILEDFRRLSSEGKISGTIEDFVRSNHEKQKIVLDKYSISLNLYAASSFGRSGENHKAFSDYVINTLYKNGFLIRMTTSQFFDTEFGVFLNGRQVVGKCPIEGCSSEKAYADECSIGHQYMPEDLIDPKSTLSGKKPEMKGVENWYLDLVAFEDLLRQWTESIREKPNSRPFVIKSIWEFLEPPIIYVKRDQKEKLQPILSKLPQHEIIDDGDKTPVRIVFQKLEQREKSCAILRDNYIRFRTGKTLVPFRITGNTEWGIPAPIIEGVEGLTFWVWPESLWAPISFTMTYLESLQKDKDAWREFWCSKDSKVYQFIGEDNVYFYGPVETALFMGMQGGKPVLDPEEGQLQIPDIIANSHILFLDKKASSSGAIKPPSAEDLLNYYTPEQLRAHFLSLGLGLRSVGFKPKPLNPNADQSAGDPVLKEGNLLSNVFNRAVRSCFYGVQKYTSGKIPMGEVSTEVLSDSESLILEYENRMHKCELHLVINLMDSYLHGINKFWSKNMKEADAAGDDSLRRQTLIDAFHMIRTAAVLMHPIAPQGTEMIREYLRFDESFWSWDRIFEPVYSFMKDPVNHELKYLEPRVDFFTKHPNQIQGKP